MLIKIQIKNFKCFRNLVTIPLTRLNLFTGRNSTGKSTAIQSVLLIRQSLDLCQAETSRVILNGKYVRLGTFRNIKNCEAPKTDPIEFIYTLTEDTTDIELQCFLEENAEEEMTADVEIKGKYIDRNPIPDPDSEGDDIVLFGIDPAAFGEIHYVSPHRISPREFYPRRSGKSSHHVGPSGKYTPNVLHASQKHQWEIAPSLILDPSLPHRLLDQSNAWLNHMFDCGNIGVTPREGNIVFMHMTSGDSEKASAVYNPSNFGFGIHYALPIVVSGLAAKKGEMLIVENPEAHLHPLVQYRLARFLAAVSQAGVQVILESHSESIMNGLKNSVREKTVSADQLNILYFQHDAHEPVLNIPVDSDGTIKTWPRETLFEFN
ncbi:MAG: AAA family ATPase [Candidatus Omnitrophota bacterium]